MASALRHFGGEVTFLTPISPSDAKKIAEQLGFNSQEFDWDSAPGLLRDNPGSIQSGVDLIFDVRDDVDGILLDSYRHKPHFARSKQPRPILARFADLPNKDKVDVLLDYGFDASITKHVELGTLRNCFGPLFAPIWPSKAPFFSGETSEPQRLVLSLGSNFGFEHYRKLLNLIKESGWQGKLLIVTASKHGWANHNFDRVEIVEGQTLESIWRIGDFVVTNAGVTFMERLAAGLGGISVVVADNQLPSASAATSFSLDEPILFQAEDFDNKFLTRLLSAEHSIQQSLHFQSLIDGQGCHRLARNLMSLSSKDISPTLSMAHEGDLPWLLSLGNQSSVRLASKRTQAISAEEHLSWWRESADRGRETFIYSFQGAKIGYVRLEKSAQGLEISYAIDEGWQGGGFGRGMLELFFRRGGFEVPVFARVNASNSASLHLLRSFGFVVRESSAISSLEEVHLVMA